MSAAATSQPDAVFAAYLADHPGLTHAEAARLLSEVGPNDLTPGPPAHPVLATLAAAALDPMALLLLAAMAVYLLTAEYVDATVALIGLLPVIGVNVVLELRAERTLEALRERVAAQVAVWRQGERCSVPIHALVPGDLCFLQEGDVIPADGVMVAGSQLAADEASLTGESLPVHKAANGHPEAEQLLAGSAVLSGRALAQITATGAATQYGRIGLQLGAVTTVATPFQRMVQVLVRRMAVLGVGASLLVAALAYWRGEGLALVEAAN